MLSSLVVVPINVICQATDLPLDKNSDHFQSPKPRHPFSRRNWVIHRDPGLISRHPYFIEMTELPHSPVRQSKFVAGTINGEAEGRTVRPVQQSTLPIVPP